MPAAAPSAPVAGKEAARHGDTRRAARRARVVTPGEDGVAEFVIVVPVFLTLIFLAVQFALWGLAAHAVEAAAAQGGEAARLYGSSPGAGATEARQLLGGLGGGLVRNVAVTETATAGDVTVRVTGDALTILPVVTLSVSGTSTGPVETYERGA